MSGLMNFIHGLFGNQPMPGGFLPIPNGQLQMPRPNPNAIPPVDLSAAPTPKPEGLPGWVQGLNTFSQEAQQAQQQRPAVQIPQAPPIQAGRMPQFQSMGQQPMSGAQGHMPPYAMFAALMSQLPRRSGEVGQPVRAPHNLSDAMRMLVARGRP